MRTPWIEGKHGTPYYELFGKRHEVARYADWEKTVTMGKFAACREIFFSNKLNLPKLTVLKATKSYYFIYKGKLHEGKVEQESMLWNTAIRHVIETYQPSKEELEILDGIRR